MSNRLTSTENMRWHNQFALTFLLVGLVFLSVACNSGPPPIVFESDRDGNREIYSVTPSGSKETNLTNSPADELSPVVSPNRKLVAYQTGLGDENAIEIISLNGKTQLQMTQKVGFHDFQRWSPSSDRIAYVVENGRAPAIYVADTDGSNPLKLSSISGQEVGDWSLGRDSVLFVVREGPAQGIYMRNPDGVNERRLSTTPDYSPMWSPDAFSVAFLSTRDGNAEIYIMDVDAGKDVRLTETDTPEYDISWSPNGRKLLFVSEQDGNPEIYIMNSDGTEQTRLTYNSIRDEKPVWSPDGTQIAFVSYLDGDAEIFVMEADGTSQNRLTNNDAMDTNPSW